MTKYLVFLHIGFYPTLYFSPWFNSGVSTGSIYLGQIDLDEIRYLEVRSQLEINPEHGYDYMRSQINEALQDENCVIKWM